MKTELSFLVELLLNHKLPKSTQTAVKDRIAEVERVMSSGASQPSYIGAANTVSPMRIVPGGALALPEQLNPATANQPESTRRLLEKHPDLIPGGSPIPHMPTAPPVVITNEPAQPVIINSPIVADALRKRQEMLNAGIAGMDSPSNKGKSAPKSHA